MPALATQVCALIDSRFDVRSRVRAADPLTGGLSEAWDAHGDAGVDPSLTRPEGFREVRARIVADPAGLRWLRWPWRAPETRLGGLVEIQLGAEGAPAPALAEAARAAAEALANRHFPRLSDASTDPSDERDERGAARLSSCRPHSHRLRLWR